MKKLIDLIKPKEVNKKTSASLKKLQSKEKNEENNPSREPVSAKPRDLFWDDYSDIGYC